MLERVSSHVKILGRLLGEAIARDQGDYWVDKIEKVRALGKDIAKGEFDKLDSIKSLQTELKNSSDKELLILAQAFSKFFKLTNVAEQQYTVSEQGLQELELAHPLQELSGKLSNVDPEKFTSALNNLHIELVLTAHPTEINRRTMIHKYHELTDELDANRVNDSRVVELVEQIWNTSEKIGRAHV